MSDVILVLGMHRSGTSATAGVLTQLGGEMPKHQMTATSANEKGYFESLPFYELHEELLASAGTEWHDWRPFNAEWGKSSIAADFRRRAQKLFLEEFEGASLPVLKDPRICRFAPFWLDLLREMELTPHIVMPVRSPLAVAQSLKREHGLSLTHGMLLWLRHVLDAEKSSRTLRRKIFAWKDLLSDWRGVCDKIAEEAEVSWPRLSDRASCEIDRFLSDELDHHDSALRANSGEVHEWTRRTYDALIELSKTPLSNSALATLDEVRAALDQSGKIFGRLLIEKEISLEEAWRQVSALAEQINALQVHREEILAEKAAAAADLLARAQQAEAKQQEAARHSDALSGELAVARGELERIEAELQARRQELAEKAAAVTKLATRAEQTEAEKQEATRQRDALSSELAAVRGERDMLSDARASIEAELHARQQELTEKVAAASELASRAEQTEAEKQEATRQRDALSSELAAVRGERDMLGEERARLAAELRAHQQELAERAAAAADLLARAEQAEAEQLGAARLREELSGKLTAACRERDMLDEELGGIEAKLRAHQQELEEKAAAAAGLLARAEQAEAEQLEAARERDTLSGKLTAARRERDMLGEERIRIEARLRALQQELEEKATRAAGLLARAEQAEAERLEAARHRDALASELAAARRERDEERARVETELRAQQQQLAERAAAAADLLARAERNKVRWEETLRSKDASIQSLTTAQANQMAQYQATRQELIDKEAALSKAKLDSTQDRFAKWLAPSAFERRRIAALLLRSRLFDAHFYIDKHPEVIGDANLDDRRAAFAAVTHYIEVGFSKGHFPNPLFDTRWYLERYEDVRRAGINPLLHYLLHGVKDGRDPGPGFQTSYYLEANPDVREAGVHPLAHYLWDGQHEGRRSVPAK